MEKDYEDIRETDLLIDNELRALVRDQLESQLAFDPDDVDVSVRSGIVRLSGRVGTEEEPEWGTRVPTWLASRTEQRAGCRSHPARDSPEATTRASSTGAARGTSARRPHPVPSNPFSGVLARERSRELFGTTMSGAISAGFPGSA